MIATKLRWSGQWACALLIAAMAAGCTAARQPAQDGSSSSIHNSTTRPAPQIIGRSVQGRPIEIIRLGNGGAAILIIAGVHGDEPAGWYVADRLVETVFAKIARPDQESIFVIPCANPDGREAVSRTNARKVDLNRNFPASNWRPTHPGPTYGGPSPASEPETAALIKTINRLHPRLIISIHCIREGQQCNNYDGPATRPALLMSQYNHYPVRESIGYPTPGSLGTWAGVDRNWPIITLELPADESPQHCWEANRAALLAAIGQSSSGLTTTLLK